MSRRALLVGINNFGGGINSLRGCINDTAEMRGLMTTYFDFSDGDIRVLRDGEATGQGIREGLAWLLSDYKGSGKDVRVFHFSSHGTQVDDQSGDEWECVDEVIVPHDHDWNNPFRDDDLRAIFDSIPESVNFTFIADCCHSGSIQKGLLDRQREGKLDFQPRFLTPPPEITDRILSKQQERDVAADAWAAEQMATMLQDVPRDKWAEKMQEFLAQLRRRFRQNKYAVVAAERHILLAGCEDRQTSADAYIEGDYRGAFTWAIGKAIRESNGNLTYDELITRAGGDLKDYIQTPQLECPSALRTAKVFAPLTGMV